MLVHEFGLPYTLLDHTVMAWLALSPIHYLVMFVLCCYY